MAEKPKMPEFDVKTHRRLLRFVNDARSPKDLMAAAELPTKALLRDIGGHERPTKGEQREPLLGEKDAKRIIAARDRCSPLYGFSHFKEFREIIQIDVDRWLRDLILPLFGRASHGEWEEIGYDAPVGPAHAALVHTPDDGHNGRVLLIEHTMGETGRTPLWKPEEEDLANAFDENPPAPPGDNLYCSGHSFLSDGKLLAVGGGGQLGEVTNPDMAWIFDAEQKEWDYARDKRLGPTEGDRQRMILGRWYPTLVTLGDDAGRVLIVSGRDSPIARQMEVYNESTGLFSAVTGPVVDGEDQSYWWSNVDYPNIHLLRSGEIFFSRAFRELELATNAPTVFSFSGSDTGQWTELTGPAATTSREGGMSVLLLGQCSEPDRVLVVGAPRGESANTVKVIDIPPSGSTWRTYTFPDGKARGRANAVLLPDGTVFICGGTNDASDDCYLFDPSRMANNPLIPMDNMTVQRDATHDQALLLPSGKVVTIGHSKKIEVFSPPYLYTAFGFPASQPEITSWPDAYTDQPVLHGQTFEIETPQASDIGGVVIVRPMAVTHQTDTEQRVIPLSFTRSGKNTLRIMAPDGRVYPYGSIPTHTHALAPRGFYMLFVLNNNGVPSAAKFIRLR